MSTRLLIISIIGIVVYLILFCIMKLAFISIISIVVYLMLFCIVKLALEICIVRKSESSIADVLPNQLYQMED